MYKALHSLILLIFISPHQHLFATSCENDGRYIVKYRNSSELHQQVKQLVQKPNLVSSKRFIENSSNNVLYSNRPIFRTVNLGQNTIPSIVRNSDLDFGILDFNTTQKISRNLEVETLNNLVKSQQIEFYEPDCIVTLPSQILTSDNLDPKRNPFKDLFSHSTKNQLFSPNDEFLSLQWGHKDGFVLEGWGALNKELRRNSTLDSDDSFLPESDVLVSICDSGIDPNHPDLTKQIAIFNGRKAVFDSRDSDGQTPLLTDDGYILDGNGHGTHVAGIIAAEANNNLGIAGIAPNVKLMSFKVFDDNGRGYGSWIAQCINQSISYGADIINMSLGGPLNTVLRRELTRAYDLGIHVVVASGNAGGWIRDNENGLIASHPHIFLVGATDPFGAMAFFSNLSRSLSIAAPGQQIPSTWPTHNPGNVSGATENPYVYLSGTSMATPKHAGAIALITQILPQATHQELDEIFQKGRSRAYVYNSVVPDFESFVENFKKSYHKLNLESAVKEAINIKYRQKTPLLESNSKLWGKVQKYNYNPETRVLGVEAIAYDLESENNIPLRIEIKNSNAEQFVLAQQAAGRRCRVDKNNSLRCKYYLRIPFDQREGRFDIQIFALDRDFSGNSQWIKLNVDESSNNQLSIKTASFIKNNIATGKVTDFYFRAPNRFVIEGYAKDNDFPNEATYVQAFAKYCDRCSLEAISRLYPANLPLSDVEGFSNRGFKITERIDENMINSAAQIFVKVYDFTPDGFFNRYVGLANESNEFTFSSEKLWVQNHVTFMNDDATCTLDVYEHEKEIVFVSRQFLYDGLYRKSARGSINKEDLNQSQIFRTCSIDSLEDPPKGELLGTDVKVSCTQSNEYAVLHGDPLNFNFDGITFETERTIYIYEEEKEIPLSHTCLNLKPKVD